MCHFKFMLIVATVTGIANCATIDPECGSETCTCQTGYVISSDQTSCLPYVTEYYGDCSEDDQCEWLGENSECHYVCRCKEGYHWYLGQCRQYVGLGEPCSDSVDCFDGYNFEALTCTNGTCVCSDDYYQRGDSDCRKIATSLDGICALDIDCQIPFTDTECNLGKCKSTEPTTEQPETTVTTEVTQEVSSSSTTVSTTVTSTETTVTTEVTMSTTEKPVVLIGDSCQSSEDCNPLENSECFSNTGTCLCKKSYFANDDGTKCNAELGVDVQCQNDADCPIKPGKCVAGVCFCRDYYFVAEGNRKCVKTISQNNWNCLSREWCYALGPYGYCSSSGTCACSKITDLDSDNALCVPNGQPEDPDSCSIDIDCKGVGDDYVCVDEECVKLGPPELGDKCTDGELPCQQENSDCLNGKCQCVEDYVEADKVCYPIIKNLHAICEKDVQCNAGVTYSKCAGGKCLCNGDRIEYDNSCYPTTEFGSYCNNLLECTLSLAETIGDCIQCRSHKCQFPTGYTSKENKCSSGAKTAGNVIVMVFIVMLKGVFSVFS